jgi:hypothetical protein
VFEEGVFSVDVHAFEAQSGDESSGELFVDGESQGVLPLTTKVTVGKHELSLKHGRDLIFKRTYDFKESHHSIWLPIVSTFQLSLPTPQVKSDTLEPNKMPPPESSIHNQKSEIKSANISRNDDQSAHKDQAITKSRSGKETSKLKRTRRVKKRKLKRTRKLKKARLKKRRRPHPSSRRKSSSKNQSPQKAKTDTSEVPLLPY